MTASASSAPARRARTVKQFRADYGVGKTLTYAEIKAGRLRAVKVGTRTSSSMGTAKRGRARCRR